MEPITLAFVFALGWQYLVTPAIEAMKPAVQLVCMPRDDGALVCSYQPVRAPDQVAQAGE